MRLSQYALGLGAVAASVLAAPAGTAACSSNKVIDNFSKFADRTNSLGAVMGGMSLPAAALSPCPGSTDTGEQMTSP